MLLADGLKSDVISILSERYPLRVSEIQHFLLSKSKQKRTKQAIHKVLRGLLEEKVIKKVRHAYQLDPEFILQTEQVIQLLKERYFSKTPFSFSVPANSKRVFSTNSLVQHDNLWNEIITEKINSYPAGELPYLQHVPHAWFALSNTEAEIQVTELITEKTSGFYTLTNGNSALDRWIARFYQAKNSFYAVRPESITREYDHQYAIIGTYILETRYPKELALRLSQMFEQTRNLSELNLQELIAIVNMPVELTITLWNSVKRAKRLSEEVLSYFC